MSEFLRTGAAKRHYECPLSSPGATTEPELHQQALPAHTVFSPLLWEGTTQPGHAGAATAPANSHRVPLTHHQLAPLLRAELHPEVHRHQLVKTSCINMDKQEQMEPGQWPEPSKHPQGKRNVRQEDVHQIQDCSPAAWLHFTSISLPCHSQHFNNHQHLNPHSLSPV